jgi:magnesium-transporting ATPase (P-type)
MQLSSNKWHTLEIVDALSIVESSEKGLTEEEAGKRLSRYGPNRLSPPKKRVAAAGITVYLGHWVDAGVIAGVVILNALIGFIQEGKAEKALEAIRTMLSNQATVLRDNKRKMIPADELVPGDIVFLQSGDKVPADARLLRIKDLRIDESILTGESVPVEKSVSPVDENATIGDRTCIVHSGTLVTYGQGTGVVIGTGDSTEIGHINEMLARVQPLTTRLIRQMAEFSHLLTIAILGLAAATFAFGILVRNHTASEMFLAGVGLAVAAIPEGLPAIITITLAIGVQRMARRRAIIRRLPAVETLGSVTVICTDKTGTLTRNEMTVRTVATANNLFDVSGGGYDPHGGFSVRGNEVISSDHPGLSELALASLLCNDASVSEDGGQWVLSGDPTEGALVTFALKTGLDSMYVNEEFPRLDVIPFESEHKFMATLHRDHAGHGFTYLKGAPERVLEMCNRQRSQGEDKPLDVAYWHKMIDEIAARGERVLAVATGLMENEQQGLSFSDVSGGMTLLGLCGIIDPPREEAIEAVRQCRSAGICVKMITGDHAVTAKAIGAQMGIGDGVTAVTGAELEGMSDEQLRETAKKVFVFARVSPEHKLRLVQALQAEGDVVAMTGDGVNDAPALKRADVGVAMGAKGTEVAKESAEMVLADDNFASITSAVEEGRTVFDNIKKAITFILPTNGVLHLSFLQTGARPG